MASFQLNWADDRTQRRSSPRLNAATCLLAVAAGAIAVIWLAPQAGGQGVQSAAVSGLRGRL